jgi:uncharacterized membrane protein YkoI
MTMISRRHFLVWAAAAASLAPGVALADDGDHDGDDDHDEREQAEIRRAVKEGRAAPLRDILDLVARDYPGEVVRVKAEVKDGMVVYKIKVLAADGGITEVRVDAVTRQIIKARRI